MVGVGVHLEGFGECQGYIITSRGAVIKYLATLFSFCQSSSLGLDSFLISSLTANMRSSLSSEK